MVSPTFTDKNHQHHITKSKEHDNMFSIVRVPTCFSKQPTELHLSSDDMKNIKAKDPFLYFSIPGVRAARIRMTRSKDVNDPEMKALREHPTTTKITRRSCVSFECHTSVLLDNDVLKDLEDEDAECSLYDDNEIDLGVLFALAASSELQEARK